MANCNWPTALKLLIEPYMRTKYVSSPRPNHSSVNCWLPCIKSTAVHSFHTQTGCFSAAMCMMLVISCRFSQILRLQDVGGALVSMFEADYIVRLRAKKIWRGSFSTGSSLIYEDFPMRSVDVWMHCVQLTLFLSL